MSHQRLYEVRKEVSRGYVYERPVDNLSLFKYTNRCVYDGAWNNTILRCRGIVFDTQTGTIVGRPLNKFFNVGERSNTNVKVLSQKFKKQRVHATIKIDGCFEKDTFIAFCDGTKHRIKDVVDQKMIGPIWGYDHETAKIVPTQITAWHNNGIREDWYTIRIEPKGRGSIKSPRCTSNHEFYTDEGYVKAKDLKVGQTIYELGYTLDNIQRNMLLGTLLGDTSISKQAWHPINGSHPIDQEALITLIGDILTPLHLSKYTVPGNSGRNWAKKDIIQYNICGRGLFDEFYELCIDPTTGLKTVTKEWLEQFDPIALAFWYMDDGSLARGNPGQKPGARFSTEAFSENELDLIIDCFHQKYGWTFKKQQDKRRLSSWALRLNNGDAEEFWKIVAPYIIPELQYKLPEHHRCSQTFWDTYSFPEIQQGLQPNVIKSIEEYNTRLGKHKNRTHAYDLTTETHNYFAKGILVHNSMVSVFHYNGEWRTATPGSLESPQAQYARRNLLPKYNFDALPTNLTYVCEMITPWDRECKVCQYGDRDELIVLAVFENKWESVEVPRSRVLSLSERAGLPVVEEYPVDLEDPLGTPIPDGEEGFVIRFDDGFRVKVKSRWFFHWHSMVDKISYRRIAEMLEQAAGDVKEMSHTAPPVIKERLDDVVGYIMTKRQRIETETDEVWARVKDPKDFRACADLFKQYGPLQAVLFARMRNREESPIIWKMIKKELIAERKIVMEEE